MSGGTKRRSLSLLAALAVCASARAASADVDDDSPSADRAGVLHAQHRTFESPQNFAFELRFAPYRPDIDGDPALHGSPYTDTYGTVPHLFLGAELDWQALRIKHFGSVGPGVGIGAVSMSRPAKFASARADNAGVSAEQTTLSIYPFYAVAVARADFLEKDLHIPFVPYVKVGLGLALWRASNDAGTSVSNQTGIVGKGHTFFVQTALGLAFDLNVLDEHAARDADTSIGINHTYFYAEYFSSDPTIFGGSQLRVGTSAFAFGLAFEM